MRQLPEAVCIRRFPCEQFARAALQHFSVNFDNSVCTIKHTHHDVTDGLVDACLVEDFGAVGGGEDDQPDRAVEAVHLCEQLVEGLLALVVAADAARMSPAQRIDELRPDALAIEGVRSQRNAVPRRFDGSEHGRVGLLAIDERLDAVAAGQRLAGGASHQVRQAGKRRRYGLGHRGREGDCPCQPLGSDTTAPIAQDSPPADFFLRPGLLASLGGALATFAASGFSGSAGFAGGSWRSKTTRSALSSQRALA